MDQAVSFLAVTRVLFRERVHDNFSNSPFHCLLFLFTLQCDLMWMRGNFGQKLPYIHIGIRCDVIKLSVKRAIALWYSLVYLLVTGFAWVVWTTLQVL